MQYLGGKAKLGRRIAHVINAIREPGQTYWEPFCGSCWVTMHVRGGPRYASDGCPELIAMWKALQDGREPPTVVSEAMYQDAKVGKYPPHVRGFIGFGCSFGGKWFAGYARGENGRSYAANAQRSVMWQARRMRDVSFFCADYAVSEPGDSLLIYADPPYAGTEGYDGSAFPFDTGEFWQTARQWVGQGHTVLVSEYRGAPDFLCVCEFPTTTEIRTGNGREPRTERLFMHATQTHLFDRRVTVQAPLFADVVLEATP